MSESQVIAGRFEILSSIGQGGMGDVFKGLDRQTGEPVAIKLLKPDIVAEMPSLIERFEREGEVLRQLDHPNIVKVLATVEENDLHYIVLEYVEGGSLRDLLDQQPLLPVAHVMQIALDLADALTRAHRLAIIHRDIKPANVLLAEDGTPRLTDFGVARVGGRTRMTETGSLIGTYAYLSPEACMSNDLDQRTDIWSFGIMLYEMLAGQRPFESDQPTAILLKIINEPVPELTEFRPDVPPALVDLIYRMLEKDRNQRVPSVRQVGAELEAILFGLDTPQRPVISPAAAGQMSRFATPTPSDVGATTPAAERFPTRAPVHTQPAATLTQPEKVRKLSWAMGGFVAVLVVLVAVVIGLLGWGDGNDDGDQSGDQGTQVALVEPVAPDHYMVLVAQLEPLAGQDSAAGQDVTRFIVQDLTQKLENDVSFSRLQVREYPAVITSADGARAAAEANAATVVIWGNTNAAVSEINVGIGVTDAFPLIQFDRETLERTINVRVHMTDPRAESLASLVLGVINVLNVASGDGFETTRTVTVLDAIDVVAPEIVSGGSAGSIQEAIQHYLDDTREAIAIYTGAIEQQGGSPFLYLYRGSARLRAGYYDEALRDIETAQRLGPDTWAAPAYLLGMVASGQDDLGQALIYYDRVVELLPDDWFVRSYRGALHYLLGHYDQARVDLEYAVELGPKANFPYLLLLILGLREGDLTGVPALFDAAVTKFPDPQFSNRMLQALFGGQVPNLWGPVLAALGNLVLGQYDDALVQIEAALAVDDRLPELYMGQGMVYCNLRDYEAAEEAYTRGIALDPDLVALYALRAEVRNRMGDTAGVLQDGAVVLESDVGSSFAPLLEAGLAGEWSCETFFSYDYAALETGPAGDTTVAPGE
ncbi:MAG: tetratricopeptide repeat protein [Anaerolineae bacterium]|nr:tetratricopeptide repeat protein [Anaerolineae bacterium]